MTETLFPTPVETAARVERRVRTASTRRMLLSISPLIAIVVIALLSPALLTFDPERVVGPPATPPNGTHWFGTDASGMDVWSRVVAASQINLLIAGGAVLATSVLALVVGLLTGMNESHGGLRGLTARGLSRALDLFDAVPAIIVAMVLVTLYGVSPVSIIVSISIILVPGQARLVRTEVLRVRNEAYLDAARMAGASESELIVREVLPNASWPVIENINYVFGVAVILTATLGFLGIGLAPPTPEWGSMIARGASDATVGRWWAALFPTLALIITVASVTLAVAALRRRD
ncbi:MAG: ABC transporter permease [Microbacterium sp.]|uniref:ABC transporter permease n=1 Tax=Microbacterium sp. TaxID=51671 RepID=UPI0027237D37|nr:ABC transporter permease [Microbacterium sp.]MDO8382841.1 ABC transporter permease [Microbacterium sp.]